MEPAVRIGYKKDCLFGGSAGGYMKGSVQGCAAEMQSALHCVSAYGNMGYRAAFFEMPGPAGAQRRKL